jgi:short-subunit dehydrogenase
MRTLIVGNGHGIGLALTKRLLGDGNDVVGVSRHFLDPICDRHTQHSDALDPGFPELIAKIVAEKSPIDTLVYCAGIGEPFETSGVDRDGDTIRVNLAALPDAVRAVLPSMRARESASKAGMTTYLLGLRGALRKSGVQVSVVRFGFVDTKWQRRSCAL